MTTPEEMAGKRRGYKAGDVVRVRGIGPSVRIIGLLDTALVKDDRTGTLYDVEGGRLEGVVVNRYPGDLNPRVDHRAMREEQTAKGAALAASAVAALETVGAILGAHEQGERDASKFAALGKRLVRQVAHHAVLECVPSFVFEVAK